MHNTMYLFNLLISGFFSDRFGRKNVFIFSVLAGSVLGVSKSFSINYGMFLAFEMIETIMASGFFISAYILGNYIALFLFYYIKSTYFLGLSI